MLRKIMGWGVGNDGNVPWTCLHVWCCARLWAGVWGMMVTFLELVYMFDARQYLRSFVWRHNTGKGKDQILAALEQLRKRHNCQWNQNVERDLKKTACRRGLVTWNLKTQWKKTKMSERVQVWNLGEPVVSFPGPNAHGVGLFTYKTEQFWGFPCR